MDVITTVGVGAETKPIIHKPYGGKAQFASCIPIFVNDGGLEIKPLNVGKIHPMLGEIGASFQLGIRFSVVT